MKQLVCEMCGSADIQQDSGDSNNKSTVTNNHIKNVSVGDIVKLGKYEQGNGIEDIEWQVLAVDGHNALLISKYVLEMRAYNKENVACTWETCTLRQWLNTDFYNNAFDKNEKESIVQRLVNDDIDFSYKTTDNVFLLSIDEVQKYFPYAEKLQCKPTIYARDKKISLDKVTHSFCPWWLRSPGSYGNYAAYIFDEINKSGKSVSNFFGVRPALLVKQES